MFKTLVLTSINLLLLSGCNKVNCNCDKENNAPFQLTSDYLKQTIWKGNIWYIYDMHSRIALSYYDDEYISWVYGMNEWFDSISVKSISMSALYQLFTIIGL